MQTSSAFSFAQTDIDHVLRLGGNTYRQRERIVAAFEEQKSISEIAAYLQNLFTGGNGIGSIAAWYSEDGIHLSHGKSARYDKSAQVISWESAADRIGQLLQDGQFATNVELAEAAGYERSLLAEKFWYLYRDFSDKARESGYLPSLANNPGRGFPEEPAWLTEQLRNPEFRQNLAEEYAAFWTAYQQDRELLRFHHHKPKAIWKNLQDLSLPRTTFSSQMTEVPAAKQFISDDEIDAAMTRGSGVSGGKGRIFVFFQEVHTDKEKADFLRHEYGIGGRSHALSGAMGSHEDHDGKGLRYKKDGCPDVHFTWEKVAKRITGLFQKGRYLTEQEQAEYDKIQAEKPLAQADAAETQQPDPAVWEYNGVKERHPDDMVLYQMGDFFELYGEDAKEAAPELGLQLFSRAIPGGGRVEMCGFPANRLEQIVEQLRDKHDVTISAVPEGGKERQEYSMPSIDHEAEQHINAQEAEFGADGTRVFRDTEAAAAPTIRELHEKYKPIVMEAVTQDTRYRNACGHSDYENAMIECNAAVRRAILDSHNIELIRLFSDVPEFRQRLHREVADETYPKLHELLRPLSDNDIDRAIQDWNGKIESKHTVVRYMEKHGRGKDTAAWLAHEFDGGDGKTPFAVRPESPEGTALPWPKVQRRIAQLIKEDRFLTEQDRQSEPQSQEKRPYQVVVYHHFENGFDEKKEYPTLEEAEKAAQSYVDGTMEPDGFAYDGAAVYDLEARQYLRMYGDYSDEKAHEQLNELAHPHDLQAEVEAWEAEQAAQKQAVIDTLSEQEQLTVRAMETAGFIFNPQAANPGLKENLVFTAGEYGYPIAFENWEQAYMWIDGAELRDTPGLREEVQQILHPEPQNDVLTNEDYAAARGTVREQTSYDPSVPPYHVGDIVYLDDRAHQITELRDNTVELLPTGMSYPIYRAAEEASYEEYKENLRSSAENFRISDDHLGEGGPKAKFQANIEAIKLLKYLEETTGQATPEQQEVLSRYVGWGGLADAFDPGKENWNKEYSQLKELLTPEEYAAARSSTLNAHYTSPTVIRAIFEAVSRLGFQSGNILEPACGVGNFFGMLPEEMQKSRLYGVELDSISGRIAQQLYPEADITVAGFETTNRRDFYDLAIGNVPFGQYQVNDKAYNKLGFSIHNYFFAKALDQVRPGGLVAFVTSRYTMDAKDPTVRRYLAQRAELLGAIRLPNNAFQANAGTDVVSDILFLQRREQPIMVDEPWVHLGISQNGIPINSYFVEHPEMVLGELTRESTQYGREEATVRPLEGVSLADQLLEAVQHIQGNYQEAALPDLGDGEAVDDSIPADPDVKNYSFTVSNGEIYYRENSRMVRPQLSTPAKARVKAMVELRDCVHHLIDLQLQDGTDGDIQAAQQQLNALYDAFTPNFGLVNDKANRLAFSDDASYYLLCALEVLDQDGKLERKADLFTKRTIRPQRQVTSVDTPSEALAVSLGERGRVDLSFMAELLGTPGEYTRITQELSGIIFRDPMEAREDNPTAGWHTADDYLSGNVREKLRQAKQAAQHNPAYAVNVEALTAAQPRDLDASEIEARLGATWIEPDDIQKFMVETFDTPYYMRRAIQVQYSAVSAEWRITGKSMPSQNDVAAYMTYGTDRANAYKILEETLNLKDIRIYDTVEDADGKQRRVLNKKATTLAQQKQQAMKDAFQDWLWKDPRRRERLVAKYNEQFNSTRPREYDGSHIVFGGMNPEIQLREHQKNAIAHILYGGNTLLAHEVGAGKTFEMVAAAMESKRLGLCQKSMFVVPNHLTEQWASEFLRLYPSANLLVTTKKDFEAANRKKFCARIATGDYDAIIIGHSQFERIPISKERQARILEEQIDEIEAGLSELQHSRGESFTIKQMEKTRKSLQAKLEKLMAEERKDDVIDFEQLGVDRLFVDESQAYKNLFLYTKMRNVAGLSTVESQRSSDMFAKCRYMDELTGNRGVIFASGTPVSNSMTELYSVMRYLQYSTLRRLGMTHFDCWASTFGETTTAIELAPEGTGYRARTRFSKFFNLPELMNIFKEVADIKTADQLHLPVPEAKFETVVVQPSQLQQEMVQRLSDRAAAVHSGKVDASEDNMLKITSDGRKIGLDQRLMNPLLPNDPNSKVNACVQNVLRIWEEGKADKLTQLLFCDLSTPKNDGSFNIYDDIKGKLLAAGVPETEIAFIHQADTEVKKKDLFAKVRSGQVRILLGSTQKMGAGTNVQDKLVALHHLDVGWRPSDMTQRNGRIIRQGNQNKEVQIYQYVTESTFDAYLFQTLEQKQRFISQIMTSKSPVRSCDDVDEQALSYAEIKALCAGNPEIKEKMDLDVEVARLKVLKADHQSQQYRLEDRLLKYFPAELELQRGFIRGFEQDVATAVQHPLPKEGFVGISIRGQTFTDKDAAGNALLAICRTLRDKEPVEVGTYRGFTVEAVYNPVKMEVQAILKGAMTHRAALGEDAKGNLLRLDHALAAIPKRLEDAKAHLSELESQRDAAQAELGKPFPQEQQLREKSARLAELNAILDLENHEESPVVEAPVAKEKPSVLQRLSALEPPVRPEHKEHKKEAERA